MTVILHVCPEDPPLSWEEFCEKTPPFSIALDGFVSAGPRFDDRGPHLNLNHHEEVDRLATRATCGQVLMVLRQGLIQRFRDEKGQFRAEVFVNDCDEDVCVSWYLLHHCNEAAQAFNPALNRLVALEDAIDSTAGAYPFPPESHVLEELAWIFDPYRQFRRRGEIDDRDADAFRRVIDEVEERITLHLNQQGEALPLDTRYRRVGGGDTWAMIEDIGSQARTGVFGDGIHAYVSVRERPDGRWTYVIGRMSPFIPFDVPAILDALNHAEGNGQDLDRWGGGSTIGGSPRVKGSHLPPEEVEKVIKETLAKQS